MTLAGVGLVAWTIGIVGSVSAILWAWRKDLWDGPFVLVLLSVGFMGWGEMMYDSGQPTADESRYCTAELSTRADTVVYLRENPECVDVVLTDEGG